MFRIFLGANWIFVFTNRNYIYESENAPIHPLPYGLFLPHVISPREIWSNNIFATGIWSLENSIWNKLSCFRYNIYTNFFIEKYVYLNIYEFHVAHPTGNFTIRHCNTERNKQSQLEGNPTNNILVLSGIHGHDVIDSLEII